jgi:hypothetical protein
MRLRFEVEDTGCGIPAEKRELVFSDYSQADGPATCQAHGGTGLGLGIVRKLVGMMGGVVEIVDKAGPGCLFRFDLVFDTAPVSSRSPSNTLWLSPSGNRVMEGFTVLICGAYDLTLGVNARALRQRGAKVLEASSWEETLTIVRTLGKSVQTGVDDVRIWCDDVQRGSDDVRILLAAGLPPERPTPPGVTVYIPGDPSSRPLQHLTLDVTDSPPATDSPRSFRNCLPSMKFPSPRQSMFPSPRQLGHVAKRKSEILEIQPSVKVAVLMLSIVPSGGDTCLLRRDLEHLHETLRGENLRS